MFPPIIEFIKNKSVLLLGFGREGQSSLAYIRKYLSKKEITIADKNQITVNDEYTNLVIGDNYLDCINDFDIVLKSPGISVKNALIVDHSKITCQVDLFLRFAPCKKVGITGSKGKTTTSTLTYLMLKQGGVDTRLIGNIGVPVFECIEDVSENTVAVIEMSSHQLEFCTASPNVAVFTNIFEEHLDHYKGGFSGYVNAKMNIARYQAEKDTFIYNEKAGIGSFIDFNSIKAKKVPVSNDTPLWFEVENEHLLGEHNRFDVILAANVAKCFGVSHEDIEKAVSLFSGIEHRMEKVGTFKGVTFYNDCIATIPFAVISAVKALKNVGTLIIGGKDRGLDYSDFVNDLLNEKIANIICMRDTGFEIGKSLLEKGTKSEILFAENMQEAVKFAYEKTPKGTACILSPAASSYNVYKNFEEKGKHYKELILEYST